jgi:deoxyxylulose-5-phosphate synthase
LHIVTVKGKGYSLAEKDQTKWHAPGLFDKVTGEIYKKKIDAPTTSEIPGCIWPYHDRTGRSE